MVETPLARGEGESFTRKVLVTAAKFVTVTLYVTDDVVFGESSPCTPFDIGARSEAIPKPMPDTESPVPAEATKMFDEFL